MAGRFIKLYDKMLQWEWFHHPNTLCLFIYLLLKANYKDLEYHGIVIKRGQLVTSLPKISTDTGLSIQQARTALKHLCSTGEITDDADPQRRVITIVRYNEYQTSTGDSTGNQQTINRRSNRRSTDDLTPSIEYIELKNYRNIESLPSEENGKAKKFTPPTVDEVNDYCEQQCIFGFDAQKFVDYYSSNGWMVGRNRMKDWHAAIRNWKRNEESREHKKEVYDLPF